ncbi:UNVERIFIED_CONTAM: Zinc finger protein ZPR1 [Sesamum angustifolium]|uniref:Zinc finger protein ZPR1 n=1 Tax=Sesamum angustifolium TaxID=2727405 RepID=A0AAW2P991_9LAMI
MKSNLLVKFNLKAVTTSWKFHQVIKRLSSKQLDVIYLCFELGYFLPRLSDTRSYIGIYLLIHSLFMFNRQVVKSETATIKIPELDFEIPPEAQRGSLSTLKSLEEPWSLIIDDALANSFVAPATDEIKDDAQLTFEEYERSWEQNEELGLNDMDTSSADVAYSCANEKNG